MRLAWAQHQGIHSSLPPLLTGNFFLWKLFLLSNIHLLSSPTLNLILSLSNPSISVGFLRVIAQHAIHMLLTISGTQTMCLTSSPPAMLSHLNGRTMLTCSVLHTVQGFPKWIKEKSKRLKAIAAFMQVLQGSPHLCYCPIVQREGFLTTTQHLIILPVFSSSEHLSSIILFPVPLPLASKSHVGRDLACLIYLCISEQ